MKASLQQQPMYCSRDHNYSSRSKKFIFLLSVTTIKGNQHTHKCFSLVYKMKPMQILVNPLERRWQIQMIHPIRVNHPDLDEEMEEEVSEQTALPFPRWNYRGMIMDQMMIIYWLRYIFKPNCCKFMRNIIHLGVLGWSWWKNCIEAMILGQTASL